MNDILLYMHSGSGNHGCEAIVNTVMGMLPAPASLLSVNMAEDRAYSLRRFCDDGRLELLQERHFKRYRPVHILYAIYRKLTGDRESFIRYRYHQAFGRHRPRLAISVGGDNYCYDYMVPDLVMMNSAFNKAGIKTVLLGCSIEPELLEDPRIVADMLLYDTIIAREPLTHAALQGIGHPRLRLIPDPAFTLRSSGTDGPRGGVPRNDGVVGINLSPLVQGRESVPGITMAACHALIRHIIENTGMDISLIPHVVWARSDDRVPLRELYDSFAATGRVTMMDDAPAEELKGHISRLRFFIGARTHATIAAYSGLVPTLAIGYSVKARGIAMDIFGTDEGYVVPIRSLRDEGGLVAAFSWLLEHEDGIRGRLAEAMPGYISRAGELATELEGIWARLGGR